MAMFSLATVPLMNHLKDICRHIWYADDAAAAGCAPPVCKWWDLLSEYGPKYSYFTNPMKTELLVKDVNDNLQIKTKSIFQDTGVQVVTEGYRYLRVPIGGKSFIESFIASKVKTWSEEIIQLSQIANTQPHAAYSVFTHGLIGRWVCFFSLYRKSEPSTITPRAIYSLPLVTGPPWWENSQ